MVEGGGENSFWGVGWLKCFWGGVAKNLGIGWQHFGGGVVWQKCWWWVHFFAGGIGKKFWGVPTFWMGWVVKIILVCHGKHIIGQYFATPSPQNFFCPPYSPLLNTGFPLLYPVKFPDFSLTFPWFPKSFPWFFISFHQDILVKKHL